jgi:hypothetical protein
MIYWATVREVDSPGGGNTVVLLIAMIREASKGIWNEFHSISSLGFLTKQVH